MQRIPKTLKILLSIILLYSVFHLGRWYQFTHTPADVIFVMVPVDPDVELATVGK